MNFRISYKHILVLTVAFGAVGAFPIYHILTKQPEHKLQIFGTDASPETITQTARTLTDEGSSVADTLIDELNAEHARLVANIQTAFAIPQGQWQEMMQTFDQYVKNDDLLSNNPQINHKANDHEIVKLARKLLAECGIDPNQVIIYTIEKPDFATNAVAEQAYFEGKVLHRIAINISRISSRSPEAQEAILRHEIRHLIFHDPLQLQLIQGLLEKNGLEQKEYIKNPAFMALNKHIEFRADLTAACTDIRLTELFKENFDYSIAQNPAAQNDDSHWVTHPSGKQRLAAMNQLQEYLKAEKQIALA